MPTTRDWVKNTGRPADPTLRVMSRGSSSQTEGPGFTQAVALQIGISRAMKVREEWFGHRRAAV